MIHPFRNRCSARTMRLFCLLISGALLLSFSSPAALAGPLRQGFQKRCHSFLQQTAEISGSTSTWADLTRLALNTGKVSGDGLRSSMKDMADRKDCSDFDVTGMLRMLWMYRNSSLWPSGLVDEIEDAILGWQFWIDEANGFQGNMMFWTENHQSILSIFSIPNFFSTHLS